MSLASARYPTWLLFAKAETVVVRGGGKLRFLPYVEKWGATYTCEALFENDKWVGKTLIMLINHRDANQAYAVSKETGEVIGELHVTGWYADKLHTISERKQTAADMDFYNVRSRELKGTSEASSASAPAGERKSQFRSAAENVVVACATKQNAAESLRPLDSQN